MRIATLKRDRFYSIIWVMSCILYCRQFTGVSVDERQSVHVYERRRDNTRPAAASTARRTCRRQTRSQLNHPTVPRRPMDKVLVYAAVCRTGKVFLSKNCKKKLIVYLI